MSLPNGSHQDSTLHMCSKLWRTTSHKSSFLCRTIRSGVELLYIKLNLFVFYLPNSPSKFGTSARRERILERPQCTLRILLPDTSTWFRADWHSSGWKWSTRCLLGRWPRRRDIGCRWWWTSPSIVGTTWWIGNNAMKKSEKKGLRVQK